MIRDSVLDMLRYKVYRVLSLEDNNFGLPMLPEAAFLVASDAVDYATICSPGMNIWVVIDSRRPFWKFWKSGKIIFIIDDGKVLKEFNNED